MIRGCERANSRVAFWRELGYQAARTRHVVNDSFEEARLRRRDFLAGAAGLIGGALAPRLALANVPTPFTLRPRSADGQSREIHRLGRRPARRGPEISGRALRPLRRLVRNEDVWDDRHKRAFLLTPREKFVLQQNLSRAYEHAFLDIGLGVTISGPHIVGRMTSTIDPRRARRCSRSAPARATSRPIWLHLTYNVYTIEIIKPLAERTRGIYDDLIKDGLRRVQVDQHQERRRLLRLGRSRRRSTRSSSPAASTTSRRRCCSS